MKQLTASNRINEMYVKISREEKICEILPVQILLNGVVTLGEASISLETKPL